MAWVLYSGWCLGRPATITFLSESSGTSSAKVNICLKTLMDDGLICEENITENRVGYVPTIEIGGIGGKAQEVVDDDGEDEEIVIGDSKRKEKEEKERKKKEAEEPPNSDTVKAVCLRKGWAFDADAFCKYYTDREWRMRDGSKITKKNWYYLGAIWAERSKADMRVEIVNNNSSIEATL